MRVDALTELQRAELSRLADRKKLSELEVGRLHAWKLSVGNREQREAIEDLLARHESR